MPSIDHEAAREILEKSFANVESGYLRGRTVASPPDLEEAFDHIFDSSTQALREVLLGCALARILDTDVDIRRPYVDQAPNAFSGRSLDEGVVNPFLQSRRIPCSKGPYLSVFRRSVTFTAETRSGIRDKTGYDALMRALDYLEKATQAQARSLLEHALFRFVQLRENANIPLSKLQRLSLDQYDALITGLLGTPSGGRFPVILAVATFRTINEHFGLKWSISWQGINVADAASGAGGDITIECNGGTVLAVEVTERAVDVSRVVTTFNTKIAPALLEDYLFVLGNSAPSDEARSQAQRYFAQGHEMNFVNIKTWIVMILATLGKNGRGLFNREIMELLDGAGLPQALRVAWNEQINALLAG